MAHPVGRAAARRRADDARRRTVPAGAPARRAPSRRGDDLPGAVARAPPDRRREHPARHGARALRAHPSRRDAPDGDRRARAARPSGDLDRRRRRDALTLPPSNWSRSAARSPSGAGCWCSTSRRAASSRADTERLFALIAELKRTGHAIVYISHFIEEVKEVADRIVVLRDGRVAGGGMTADARASRHRGGSWSAGRWTRSIPDRLAARARRFSTSPPSARRARRSRLHRGEILGIAGLLGAGRTRLVRGLFGLEPVRTGRVRLGAWSGTAAPARALAHGVRVSQRGSQGGGPRRGAVHRRQHDAVAARRSGAGTDGLPSLAGSRGHALDGAAAHQVARPTPARRRALGRQPAEGRDRAAAPPRRRRPPPRRAHARHRRREQGANLRARRCARVRAPGDRRAARAC